MSEEHDSKISDLYQTSSQETPPAHIDQAVLSMARKSVPVATQPLSPPRPV